jgi:hypothetical protein
MVRCIIRTCSLQNNRFQGELDSFFRTGAACYRWEIHDASEIPAELKTASPCSDCADQRGASLAVSIAERGKPPLATARPHLRASWKTQLRAP